LLEQRYGRAVDWWAFGVLMYEMLLGQSPFRGDDEDEIFDAILEDEPLYPITMPRDAVSILQKVRPSSMLSMSSRLTQFFTAFDTRPRTTSGIKQSRC
jgi:serine/threonine protein kinase